jgi:hypothetical protein
VCGWCLGKESQKRKAPRISMDFHGSNPIHKNGMNEFV